MRLLLLFLLALTACAPFAASEPEPAPIALPGIRHGHRVERIADGYLCFGGFDRSATADRGARTTSLLRPGSNAWEKCSSMQHAHSFFASARIDDTAYAIGSTIEKFDAAANSWQVVVEPGQLPRSHFGAAAIGNQIFVLGGFPKIGTGFAIVDVATGTVQSAEPPPTFAHGDHLHFVFALRGELHVLGGIDGEVSDMHTAHWVRRDNEWHALPDCPEDMWTKFAAYVVHNDKLFAFAGSHGWCYDPLTGDWQPRRKMPQLLAMPAAVANGDSIWVLGGMQVQGRSNVFWRYDIATDQWQRSPTR